MFLLHFQGQAKLGAYSFTEPQSTQVGEREEKCTSLSIACSRAGAFLCVVRTGNEQPQAVPEYRDGAVF